MPDEIPSSVNRVLNYLTETVFILALAMIILLLTIGAFIRVNRIANIAQYLPANTEAFIVVNSEDYLRSVEEPPAMLTELYGQAFTNYEWFDRDLAFAWVEDEIIQFVEVTSTGEAESFIESLLLDDESIVEHDGYFCFSVSQPDCFTFKGNFLALASPEALGSLRSGLEDEMAYQNVRSRLPYNASLFAYVDAQSVRQSFLTSLGDMSIWEPGYLESILHIFPAYGVSIKMDATEWTGESFLAVDKMALGDEAFFHPSVKYNANLTAYAPESMQFEWSGTELFSQAETLLSHMDELNSAAALVLRDDLQSFWSEHFGGSDQNEFGAILDNEQLIAWTPDDAMLWMIEINNDEDYDLALILKDYFISAHRHVEEITNEDGEMIASVQSLSATKEDYEGDSYIQIMADAQPRYFLAILEDLAIASNNSEYFFQTLDRWNGRADLRDLSQISPMLLGADQSIRLDMTIFPESHIISLVLPGVQNWISSTKTFDDGIYTRSILQF